jgi:hydrogenase-4 component E
MSDFLNLLIGFEMGLNLLALGGSQLRTLIRVISLQGIVMGVLTLLMEYERIDVMVILLATAMIAVKGLLIPYMLRWAMRSANIVERDIKPYIGAVPSLLLGSGGTIAAVVFARSLPLLPEHAGTLLLPGAIASLLTGLILLMGRARAISQVCGYLILENGIYLFGLLLIRAKPLLVELGILMDVTVGVFIIGIIVDRIQRAFDSQDTRKLTTLQE